ncbi:MAG: gamma-glutamyltransferase [Streptosporangiales bacterium]|nr:gamma-glutamyltransferase [Streptosporangiales bacterium]
MRHPRMISLLAAAVLLLSTVAPASAAEGAAPGARGRPAPEKQPVAEGFGGAVSTVDADATQAGLAMLRRGGNAVDAAVAAAAALGVTEPYSSGFGGGGFFAFYDAKAKKVRTLDGREKAPAAMEEDAFLEDGEPIPFAEAVTSGLGVGVPGSPLQWQRALDAWGTMPRRTVMEPGIRLAERGFVVDPTFRRQTADNEARFRDFPATAEIFLPGGELPEVGSVLRNPDLAGTYRAYAKRGPEVLYEGPIGSDLVDTVREPPLAPGSTRNARPGLMTTDDLAGYTAPTRKPTKVGYRGLEVYGMAPPSSGGSTVGEALNILETADPDDRVQALHRYLEASRLGFADRNRWLGDADHVDVPLSELLDDGFAGERACLIDPDKALVSPVAPGEPDGSYEPCGATTAEPAPTGHEGTSTTHLTTADRWGNVVAYTFTIEQTGGSGITVPGRGFLLNNQLTDFNFEPLAPGVPDPNLPAPGKRPRSSMAPTIVFKDGKPWLTTGSPGGATIITTVLQTLVNRIDLGMTLPQAIAAPRVSQRNAADGNAQAEPAFLASPEAEELRALGHGFASTPEIGAAVGLEFLGGGRIQAVAEPVRRGGGAAAVLIPLRD